MSLHQSIDRYCAKAIDAASQVKRKKKLEIYCEGLKAKANQAEYALANLSNLSKQADEHISSTDSDLPPVQERVEFYCDSFWAILYSCLDILAQIQNQGLKLNLDEKTVSFKKVIQQIKRDGIHTTELDLLSQCLNSNAFKNLDKYRNCSTHRRQICIKTQTITTRLSSGYQSYSTDEVNVVERILTDDPLNMNPHTRMNQRRMVPKYLEDTRNKIFGHIERVLDTCDIVS